MEVELFELAAKYGGLGIISSSKISDCEYHNRTLSKRRCEKQHLANKNQLTIISISAFGPG